MRRHIPLETLRRRAAALAAFVVVASIAVAGAAGCGDDARELLVAPHDGGAEPADAAPDAPDEVDGAVDPTLGGPCVDDPQCDDHADCTFDRCDQTIHRCRNVPDDTRCDDGVYCNGRETCVIARGCHPGPVVTCEDGTACTTDRCIEATRSCEHVPRDLDGDGDPDDRCVAQHDCNDLDPRVASTHPEVCDNGIDDDCDGRIDDVPCVSAANDTCATALALGGPGTYALSSYAAQADYALGCGSAGPDVVATVTVPAGGPKDVDAFLTVANAGVQPTVAIQSSCGDFTSDLACGTIVPGRTARARARSLQPGTYSILMAAPLEQSMELSVDLLAPTTKPTNETCANATPVTPGTPFDVSISDASQDLSSACKPLTGELTYAFTLAQAADVRVFATTVRGSGSAVVSLRTSACAAPTDELACRIGTSIPLFARALPAGTYVLAVAATAPLDAQVVVQTSAPTAQPADATCATAPAAPVNATLPFDLASHEESIHDGCHAGGPTAAYALPLATDSDVLLVGRFPANELGKVSLDDATCSDATRLACTAGGNLVRVSKRGLPAGDYRVVVADDLGEQGSLTTLVRPASAPILVPGSDSCANTIDVGGGGFFTGDTSGAGLQADFGASCDNASGPGAPDQILRLVLAQPARVVLDMSGSVYTTLLDVRSGATCPGTEVAGACFVGFTGDRSFLDLPLAAGTYWIQVDGYGGSTGAWNLDVRVLPP